MKQIWFGIFLFVTLFISCLDEEEIERDYPKIVTNAVIEISLSGATLSGTIETSALGEIFEYGFIWGQDEKLLPENSFSLQFATPTTNAPSAKIKSSLVSQKMYYARFYIKTGSKTIYGNMVSFRSLGSEGPKITHLTPSSGVLGDTVIIHGRNFIDAADRNVVKFAAENVSVLSVTDSTLEVIVPKDLSLEFEHVRVSVSIEGNVAVAPEPFTLLLSKIIPAITSITPQNIKACDTVLVVGKNFKSDSDFLKVLLQNNEEANLIKATDDSIMFSIKLLPSDEFSFTVKSGRFDTPSEINFTEQRPEFVSISPMFHKPGEIMTLVVKNFPTCFPLIALAYGYNAEIISRTENEIKVRLDGSCVYPGEISIGFGINYYDQFLTTPYISPLPLKILSVEPNHGAVNQEVVIRGEGFLSIQEDYTYFLNISSYTENEIRGTVKEIYYTSSNKIDVAVNACGRVTVLEKAFEYDPPIILDFNPKIITSPDQWITIEGQNFSTISNNEVRFNNYSILYETVSLDGNHITIPASVLIPDPYIQTKFTAPIKVRTQMGSEATSSIDLVVDHDGAWTKLEDFPSTERYSPISFTIAGKGYVGLGVGARYFPTRDLWEFDPATESWTRKADFPGAYESYMPDVAVANDKAYNMVMEGEFWEYDPSPNSWTQKTTYPGLESMYKLMIVINNKIYVGGGYYLGSRNEFWEYDPLTNIWTRKADIPGELSNRSLSFERDSKGYAYYASAANQKTLLTYDPATDSWSSKAVPYFDEASPWQVFNFEDYTIALGGTYYSQENVMYKIVPGNDSLIPVHYAGPKRLAGAGFSIGKTGYIGLGSYEVIYKDFWKFDPEKF